MAGCELARHGVVPRLIDKLPEPTTEYRAVGVEPRSQDMLEALGALERNQVLALAQVAIESDTPGRHGFETLARIDVTDLPTASPCS